MLRFDNCTEDEVFLCLSSFIRYEIIITPIFALCSVLSHILTRDVCFPDFPQLNGQERIKEFESILLRLDFPPIYNGNIKICCKLFPSFCYPLMDSTGFIYEPLRGRVNITEGDGWIEFKISNVRLEDEGYYRCYVLGIPDHIYIDTFVKVTGRISIPTICIFVMLQMCLIQKPPVGTIIQWYSFAR